MRRTKTVVTTLAAASLLVVAADWTTYAATGGSFILGQSNTAGKTTTLKNNGTGATLNLQTSSAARPPLATNSKAKVTNLNADSVDGKSAADLGVNTRVYTWSGSKSGNWYWDIDGVPAGDYLVSYNVNASNTTTTDPSCQITIPNRNINTAVTTQKQVNYLALNSTVVQRVLANEKVRMICFVPSGTYTFAADNPLQVSFTRIGSLTSGQLVTTN